MTEFESRRRQAGLGLVEVVLAAALATVVLLTLSQFMRSAAQSSRKIESSIDLAGIKSQIGSELSCEKTLAATPACSTANVATEVRNTSDQVILPAAGKLFGRYFIRAQCQPGTSGGLSIRAVRLTEAGRTDPKAKVFGAASDPRLFERDEMDPSLLYDWSHPKGGLFSEVTDKSGKSLSDTRLCRGQFAKPPPGGNQTCPPGFTLIGTNPSTQTPVCLSPSGLNDLAVSLSSKIKVSTTGQCPAGQTMMGMSNNQPICGTPTIPLYWRAVDDYLTTDLQSYPTCSKPSSIQGSPCTTQNERCKSSFCQGPSGVDAGTAPNCTWRRLFKCTP